MGLPQKWIERLLAAGPAGYRSPRLVDIDRHVIFTHLNPGLLGWTA
jgi:hypothetical protein